MHFLSIWYGWLIFFLSEESLPIVKKADDSYWLQYYLMAKRKLVTLLLTLAEKSVMTATAESWGRKSWNILLTEKWKQEKSNYVLLRAREKIAVNLYFICISLLGKIYSNTSTQYAGCQVPALFKDGANHGTKKGSATMKKLQFYSDFPYDLLALNFSLPGF